MKARTEPSAWRLLITLFVAILLVAGLINIPATAQDDDSEDHNAGETEENEEIAADGHAEYPPDQIASGIIPGLPPGTMLVEGDILIRIEDFPLRYPTERVEAPDAPHSGYETNLWPNGVVPYQFDPNVTAANRTAMVNAMAWWENVANVDFNQCTNNNCTGSFIHIMDGDGNWSFVGRIGGRQELSIFNWNWPAIIAHELGHALGLQHEQSRTDRNGFVTINFNNVCKATDSCACSNGAGQQIDCDHNFATAPNSLTYGPYDFGSVMHYRRDAFSRNGNDTITVNPPYNAEWQSQIGQRVELSRGDENGMGCMYPRANWRWLATGSGGSQTGSCRHPYRLLNTALSNTPSGGQLWIEPGFYGGVTTIDRPMTLTAPNGTVTITNELR